jgi:hypothetical protein
MSHYYWLTPQQWSAPKPVLTRMMLRKYLSAGEPDFFVLGTRAAIPPGKLHALPAYANYNHVPVCLPFRPGTRTPPTSIPALESLVKVLHNSLARPEIKVIDKKRAR